MYDRLGPSAAVKTCQHDARRLGLVAGAVAIVSMAVTLANPYGIHLWEFFCRTVRFNRDDIVEWHPMMRADCRLPSSAHRLPRESSLLT
jgi:hypothetical protein